MVVEQALRDVEQPAVADPFSYAKFFEGIEVARRRLVRADVLRGDHMVEGDVESSARTLETAAVDVRQDDQREPFSQPDERIM